MLGEYRRSSGTELLAKVSLAGGNPYFAEGRPYGLVMNRAARLSGLAAPGEIVVDEAVVAELPDSVSVIGTSTFELRGIGQEDVSTIRAKSIREQVSD